MAWERPEGMPWFGDNDVPADVLNSFQTNENALSIYLVEEDQLERLVAACGANRNNVQILDYVVVEMSVMDGLDLFIKDVRGELPDATANLWHRDLSKLTARKLTELGIRMHSKGKVVRKMDKEIGKLVNRRLVAQQLDRNKMDQNLLAQLAMPKYQP